jgi:hypothetical protein
VYILLKHIMEIVLPAIASTIIGFSLGAIKAYFAV